MAERLLAHEPAVRLGVFLAVLLVMAAWEALRPARPWRIRRLRRWPANLGLVALDGLLVRLVFPVAAVALGAHAKAQGWGLLGWLDLPAALEVALAVVLLDLVIYLQHVLFHAVPALWRLHRVHHADVDYDVTTGLRFHPVEILMSMVIKFGAVVALGAPAAAVLLFEVLLNATAMFNHGNVSLPRGLDRALRWLLVTPDMHRVHHSVVRAETDKNFGFNLTWWDRLLGTYQAEPAAGRAGLVIGLPDLQDEPPVSIWAMLRLPLRAPGAGPDAPPPSDG